MAINVNLHVNLGQETTVSAAADSELGTAQSTANFHQWGSMGDSEDALIVTGPCMPCSECAISIT